MESARLMAFYGRGVADAAIAAERKFTYNLLASR